MVIGIRPVTHSLLVQTPLWSLDVVCCALRQGTSFTLSQSVQLKLGTSISWELTRKNNNDQVTVRRRFTILATEHLTCSNLLTSLMAYFVVQVHMFMHALTYHILLYMYFIRFFVGHVAKNFKYLHIFYTVFVFIFLSDILCKHVSVWQL